MNRTKVIEHLQQKAKELSPFNTKELPKNPTYNVPIISNNGEWILHLYKHILNMDMSLEKDDVKGWLQRLDNGGTRQEIENYFRKVAWEHNQKNNTQPTTFEDLLDKNDKGRVLFVCKESAGDILLCTSLFKSIKSRYPDWSLYVSTKPDYKDIVIGNPHVYRWLEWNPIIENQIFCIGNSNTKGFFNVSFHPTIGTQDKLDYLGIDKLDLELEYN